MMQYKSVVVTWDFVMATLQVGLPTSGRQPDAWIYDVHQYSSLDRRTPDPKWADQHFRDQPVPGCMPARNYPG